MKETGSPEGRAQLRGVAGVPGGPGGLPREMCPLRLEGRARETTREGEGRVRVGKGSAGPGTSMGRGSAARAGTRRNTTVHPSDKEQAVIRPFQSTACSAQRQKYRGHTLELVTGIEL